MPMPDESDSQLSWSFITIYASNQHAAANCEGPLAESSGPCSTDYLWVFLMLSCGSS